MYKTNKIEAEMARKVGAELYKEKISKHDIGFGCSQHGLPIGHALVAAFEFSWRTSGKPTFLMPNCDMNFGTAHKIIAPFLCQRFVIDKPTVVSCNDSTFEFTKSEWFFLYEKCDDGSVDLGVMFMDDQNYYTAYARWTGESFDVQEGTCPEVFEIAKHYFMLSICVCYYMMTLPKFDFKVRKDRPISVPRPPRQEPKQETKSRVYIRQPEFRSEPPVGRLDRVAYAGSGYKLRDNIVVRRHFHTYNVAEKNVYKRMQSWEQTNKQYEIVQEQDGVVRVALLLDTYVRNKNEAKQIEVTRDYVL